MTVLNDEALVDLLGEAAGSYQVPEDGAAQVLQGLEASTRRRPRLRGSQDGGARFGQPSRRGVQLAAGVAVVAVAVLLAPLLSTGGGGSQSASTSVGTVARSAVKAGSAGGAGTPGPAGVPTTGARVVKTGSLALVVDDGQVTPVLTASQTAVAALQGYVASSSTQEFGATPSGTVTFRLPVANFERAVLRLRGLRATVRDAEVSGRDVTAEYADTAAQVASLTAVRSRFLTILGQAKTIGETLTVQQRVDDVQSQIDRLEGQRRVLADQSDLATLTVTVTQKDDPVSQQPGPTQGGFSRAFHDAVHGFTSGAEALIARSGRALLVLLVLGALAVVLRFGWRVVRRRLV